MLLNSLKILNIQHSQSVLIQSKFFKRIFRRLFLIFKLLLHNSFNLFAGSLLIQYGFHLINPKTNTPKCRMTLPRLLDLLKPAQYLMIIYRFIRNVYKLIIHFFPVYLHFQILNSLFTHKLIGLSRLLNHV
jgi:hypothetical protein